MADNYQIDPGLDQKSYTEKLNFILRQIFKRLDAFDPDKSRIKFFKGIDMQAQSIINGPPNQTNLAATEFVTAGYLGTKQAGQIISPVITSPGPPGPPGPAGSIGPPGGPGPPGMDGDSDFEIPILSYVDWGTLNGKLTNPMTTAGDIIYALAGGIPTRLGIGTANQVVHGGASAPSYSAVIEADFAFTNVSTANASLTKHGLLPILSGNSAQFLDGNGNFSTPSAGAINAYSSTSFSGQTSVVVTHNFGQYPAVQVLDSGGKVMQAKEITHTSLNSFTVTFVISTTGTIIATIGSPQPAAVIVVSNDYVILLTDKNIECTAAGKTMTLPTAVGHAGYEFRIDNASPGTIFVVSAGGTIEGETSQFLLLNSSMNIYSDGTVWRFC